MNHSTAQVLEPGGGTPAPRITFRTILHHPGFRRLWWGELTSQIGDYFGLLAMLIVASGVALDLQGTTLAVAGLTIADALPRLLFDVPAGVFVDRWDRRKTMLACNILRALAMLAMVPAFLLHNLAGIYALAFVGSAFGTFFNPAKSALIPLLLPEAQLLTGNALSQVGRMLSVLLGPALAGLTLKLAGPGQEWIALLVDALSFLISAAAIWWIPLPGAPVPVGQTRVGPASAGKPRRTGPELRQVWSELVAGLRLLVLNRTVVTLSIIGGMTMLGLGAANVLWLVYLKSRFGWDQGELALRLSLLGLALAGGMILSAVAVGNFLAQVAPKWLIVAGLLGTGLGLAAFSQLADYTLLFIVTFVLGICIGPINTAANTLLQIVIPNTHLGRIMGGYNTVSDVATIGSMSLAGVLGALLGISTVFLWSGLICVVVGFIAWAFLPALELSGAREDAAGRLPAP